MLQQKISILEASMSLLLQLDVSILNEKLAGLYTGFPTLHSFLAFVDYLEPKARNMVAWNSSKTKELNVQGRQGGNRCFHGISVANQLLSVLIRLRLELVAADVCAHFKLSQGIHSRLLQPGFVFFQKS